MRINITRYQLLVESVSAHVGSEGCLEWPYCETMYDPIEKRPERAHRLAYRIAHGALPTQPLIHTCGKDRCYLPAHLAFWTSHMDYLIASVKAHGESEECLEWPYGRHRQLPYGRVPFNGSEEMAHRLSYRIFKGEIPDGMDVLHSCDNPPCYNPRHLRPGTASDNQQDCVKRGRKPNTYGEFNPMHRLSESDVLKIHEMRAAGLSTIKIADKLALSHQHVWDIVKFNRWGHLKSHIPANGYKKVVHRGHAASHSTLTEKDVMEVHRLRSEGMTLQSIGTRFGVSKQCIRSVVLFISWAHVRPLVEQGVRTESESSSE